MTFAVRFVQAGFVGLLCLAEARLLAADGLPSPLFTREEVASYRPKGPSRCFRQICLEYNTTGRYDYRRGLLGRPEEMSKDFSQADAAAYAEFCRSIHLDGVLLLAVPEGGYTTYLQTRVGEPFPYLKQHGFDFFGGTIKECHRSGISVFGYIIVGWCKRAQTEFPDDFPEKGDAAIPSLNGPYAERIIQYAREILTCYPVDGLRTDILDHNTRARTAGDRAFYQDLYGEDLPAKFPCWQREQDFRLKSISRFVRRFHDACKKIKPEVEIWHNWFNDKNVVDLRDVGMVDIAYEEFADPFATLFVRGIFGTPAMISGKLLRNPQRRLCLVLGGRAYDYFPVNKKTALPDQSLIDWFHKTGGYDPQGKYAPSGMDWFSKDLAPFYAMVAEIEPYLVGAKPVADVGVIFSEASRFRFPGWNRRPVVEPLAALTDRCLAANRPLEFMSSCHLTRRRDLDQFKVLVLPDMTGLQADEHAALLGYVRRGGQLFLSGVATLYDEQGRQLPDFALADAMGLRFLSMVSGRQPWKGDLAVAPESNWTGPTLPADVRNLTLVACRPTAGETPARFAWSGKSYPLVHIRQFGKGRIAYLAAQGSVELMATVIDWLAGRSPVRTIPPERRALLTWQPERRRWVLHLMSDGPYTVEISGQLGNKTTIAAQYPADGWSAKLEVTDGGVRIRVDGNAHDRLLVLQ